jgi:UDP-glucose 4-epimerase
MDLWFYLEFGEVVLLADFSNVLVTGGAGFIGSHLVDKLLDLGFNVKVIDNLFSGDEQNLVQHQGNSSFEFVKGDIRDFDLVKSVVKGVDAVFHEAALVSVTQSIEDPVLSNEINVNGSLNLLKASFDCGVKRFVCASSCAVYGESDILPVCEDFFLDPLSPYAVDKLALENYAKIFFNVYGLETVCLRYFNVYGPRQKGGPYSGVISVFINNLLEGKSVTIFGNGQQTRDFVNIQDVVNANLVALSKGGIAGQVFNVSSGKAYSINEVFSILQKITGNENEPEYSKPRVGDIFHSFADLSKAKRYLGYQPKVGLKQGLEELVSKRKDL